MRCQEVVERKNAVVVIPHVALATHVEVVMMIVLRVGELRESRRNVDEAISQPSIGGWIVSVESSVALKPIGAKVLDALVRQLERLHVRCTPYAHMSLVIVSNRDCRFSSHRSRNRQGDRAAQAAARTKVVGHRSRSAGGFYHGARIGPVSLRM